MPQAPTREDFLNLSDRLSNAMFRDEFPPRMMTAARKVDDQISWALVREDERTPALVKTAEAQIKTLNAWVYKR